MQVAEGQGRVSAGLAALRAATSKGRVTDDVRERLAQITDRGQERGGPSDEEQATGRNYARDRLKLILDWDAAQGRQAAVHKLDGHSELEPSEDTECDERKPSVKERLEEVLNKPREKLEAEDAREVENEKEVENESEIDREVDRDRGLSH